MGGGAEAGVDGATPELLALARAQGMNTDVRRRIFVALMGSQVCPLSDRLCTRETETQTERGGTSTHTCTHVCVWGGVGGVGWDAYMRSVVKGWMRQRGLRRSHVQA
jgi:hypothetical protein